MDVNKHNELRKSLLSVTNTDFELTSKHRIKLLKDAYKSSKVVIFTCGPSLKNVSTDDIKKLIDKGYIIICVKQAIDSMPDKFCHFHVLNFCNEKKYTYGDVVPIRLYCQRSEAKVVKKNGFEIVVSHYLNNVTDNIITSMMNNVDEMGFDKLINRNRLKVKWGDTMYELALPLALYIGCSNIYIIGWDCKNFSQHFYGKDSRGNREGIRKQLDKLQVTGGTYLHQFFKQQFNVTVNLVGKGDESVFEIPYISLNELL